MRISKLGVAGLVLIAVFSSHPFLTEAAEDNSPIITPDGGRYFGSLVDGKLQGKGRATWSNGTSYEGWFDQGLFSGNGRLRYTTGDVYEGNFEQGLQSGMGRLTTQQGHVFVGEFSKGELNGKGRQDGPSGTVYEGGFKANLYDGYGKLISLTGEYSGEFRSGEYSGQGEMQFKDGRKYSGAFAHGRYEGKGRLTYPTGVVYEGDFLAGEFTGLGVATFPGGATHEGQFLNWKPEGHGVFTNATGSHYEGHFKEGNIVGVASLKYKDGTHYEGEFKNWMPSGSGELHRANGDVYKGAFAYGEFDGEGTLTYAKPQADGRKADSGTWTYGRFKKTEDEKRQRARANVETAMYSQSELLRQLPGQLDPRDPKMINMYFLAVAGDGSQEVFHREVEYVRNQFDSTFVTRGHSLALVNSRNTVAKSPLATVTSIRQAVNALAEQMDTDRDILFLYITSHGSKEGEISLGLPGMEIPGLTARELSDILKQSRVRWKVVVLSSCYAGTFINDLKDPNTLIMTAARHDRQSFGCADENEFTYFGRAFFKEALPQATSFEDAFTKADGLISEWEDQEIQLHPLDKEDNAKKDSKHHSLPQMLATPAIRDHLRNWWGQLPKRSPVELMSFAERVAAAKQLEEQKETQDYFNERMFPVIGKALADAIRDCTGEKKDNMDQFAVVANILSDGSFSNIDQQPKTLTAICFADAVAAIQVPPPPVGANGYMPIVLEMSARP
jgi:hypothetical protein